MIIDGLLILIHVLMRSEENHKNWNQQKTNDSWAIFKIMGEFVNGYEKMSRIGPCVSIFGSARTKPEDKYYKLAQSIATHYTEWLWSNHWWWSWYYGSR